MSLSFFGIIILSLSLQIKGWQAYLKKKKKKSKLQLLNWVIDLKSEKRFENNNHE